MNAKLNDIRIYWGRLSTEILVGFQSKRNPRCVTGNINVTDMVLNAVSSMLLEGGNSREGSIEMHSNGIDGPESLVLTAQYKHDIDESEVRIRLLEETLDRILKEPFFNYHSGDCELGSRDENGNRESCTCGLIQSKQAIKAAIGIS